jgi:hypothetical protein
MWYTDPRVAIVAQIPLTRDAKRAVASFYLSSNATRPGPFGQRSSSAFLAGKPHNLH